MLDGFGALYTLLRSYFLTGIIVLVPVAATMYVTFYLFIFADGILGEAVSKIMGYQIPGIGLMSTVFLFIMAGMVAQNVFGRRLLRWMDISLQSLPFVRSLYVGIKQVSDILFQQQQSEFQRVVMVEYPKENCWAIGFVTGDFPVSLTPGGFPGDMVCVFVPTTPNPTSGYLLMLSKSKVVDTAIGIEEAMKMIISGGLVKPGTPGPAVPSSSGQAMLEDFTIPR